MRRALPSLLPLAGLLLGVLVAGLIQFQFGFFGHMPESKSEVTLLWLAVPLVPTLMGFAIGWYLNDRNQ